jgi:hypothetical protein
VRSADAALSHHHHSCMSNDGSQPAKDSFEQIVE